MDAVEKELDRVITKFSGIKEHTSRVITDITTIFEEIKNSLNNEQIDATISTTQLNIINETLQKTKEKLQRISTEHRDLHGTVSKVGKVIDRNFVSDFTATTRSDFPEDDNAKQLLNKIIAQHYSRQGMDDIAKSLIQEANLPAQFTSEILQESSFAEIYRIWEKITDNDLGPALVWATKYSDELAEKNSALEFKLHRLVFVQILLKGTDAQAEAIQYARSHFSKLINRFEKEIQHLMGTLIYLPTGIHGSPYKDLVKPELWTEVSYIFLKDACTTVGICKDSLLSIVVNAGCTALPALLNIKQVMLSRKVLGVWKQRDELPIDIELDAEHRYHSIFACPILRQQTYEENPPMKLACGHVISRNAWSQLSHGPMLKCPYCPMEQSPDEAKYIYF